MGHPRATTQNDKSDGKLLGTGSRPLPDGEDSDEEVGDEEPEIRVMMGFWNNSD